MLASRCNSDFEYQMIPRISQVRTPKEVDVVPRSQRTDRVNQITDVLPREIEVSPLAKQNFLVLQNERDGYVNIEALGANERNQFR